ncbi:MAG TPA: HU family DNA-binding protein [Clostridia bacterium]|jgi:DNA-binding protein HU-beta|nr:HU family DNA-binding protein [Clostridia bacterium]
MNKKELIAAIASKTGLTQVDAGKAIDALIQAATDALKAGETVQLLGFCTIKAAVKPARTGVNPANGKKITIPAKKVVKIKAGKALEEAVK